MSKYLFKLVLMDLIRSPEKVDFQKNIWGEIGHVQLNKLEFEFAHLIRWKWGTPDSKRSESANLHGENWACPEIRTFEHQRPCTSTHCVSFSHQKKVFEIMLRCCQPSQPN